MDSREWMELGSGSYGGPQSCFWTDCGNPGLLGVVPTKFLVQKGYWGLGAGHQYADDTHFYLSFLLSTGNSELVFGVRESLTMSKQAEFKTRNIEVLLVVTY